LAFCSQAHGAYTQVNEKGAPNGSETAALAADEENDTLPPDIDVSVNDQMGGSAYYWKIGRQVLPVRFVANAPNNGKVEMAFVRKQLPSGELDEADDLVRKDRLYDDPNGLKKANFSGASPEVEAEVVDAGSTENSAFFIFSTSKENFARMIKHRLGDIETIYMTSKEPQRDLAAASRVVIRWVLNVCIKDVKFNLCFRKGDNPSVGPAECYWENRKFYFQLYAKEKSPVIYLALKSGDSPTWTGFIAAGPGAEKEKHKVEMLTQVYKGTIDDLAKRGFAKTTWAAAKGE
jgi:hypothetical protein